MENSLEAAAHLMKAQQAAKYPVPCWLVKRVFRSFETIISPRHMRSSDIFTENLLTIHKLEDFIPDAYSLRSLRLMANAAPVTFGPLLAGIQMDQAKDGSYSVAPRVLSARRAAASALQPALLAPVYGTGVVVNAFPLRQGVILG